MTPISDKGYELLHAGSIALARLEANGMKVDEAYLDEAIENCAKQSRELRDKLMQGKMWASWRRRFGAKAKITSDDQLKVLLRDMGYTPASADESELEKIDIPFIAKYIKLKKLIKAGSTYLRGIKRECVGGYIHPFFHLHTVVSYRSSSSNPNFQNFPVRNPEIAEMIRRCFVSRWGDKGVLVENDFKGAEVNVACCYHHDPTMIKYQTAGLDMHGDMAAQIYMLPVEWLKKNGKQHRYGAKNKFVFPQFYGDYYVACAKNMWEWAERAKLQAPGGVLLLDWLKAKGITGLGACDPEKRPVKGTFEHHMQAVEHDFWNNRFGVYGQWKKDWYQAYLKKGFFETHTGFRIEGVMERNQVTNLPVQGSAFHCLLWVLIRVLRKLRKYKMKSVVAGQVHDSIVADVLAAELDAYLNIVHETISVDLVKAWADWLVVPIPVENEISPLGSSWFDKREVEYKDGVYVFKDDDEKITCTGAAEFLQAFERKTKYTQETPIHTGSGKYSTYAS